MLIVSEPVCHISTCTRPSCKEKQACEKAVLRQQERLATAVPTIALVPADEVHAKLIAENKLLRRRLAVRTCSASLYNDDGELSDASVFPFIDFKRDTAEEIEKNLRQRDLDRYQALIAAQ